MPKLKTWLVMTSEYRKGKRKGGEKCSHILSSYWLSFSFSSQLLRSLSTKPAHTQHGWHAQSISMHNSSSILPWKLEYPNRTVSVRCPEVQNMTEIVGHKDHQTQWCVFLLERKCQYALQVSMGTTWIFIIGQSLRWSSDFNICFLEEEEYWGKKRDIIPCQN